MSEDLLKYFADLQKAKKDGSEKANQPNIQSKKFNDLCNVKPGNSQQASSASKAPMFPTSDVTFLSILNNGCSRNGWTPKFETVGTVEMTGQCYKMRCTLIAHGKMTAYGNMVACGKARSKKAAKQMAAKEILLQIVEKGCISGFDLYQDKEKAIQYLDGLSSKLEVDEEVCATQSEKNWVGKLTEFCSRLKINSPEYTYEEKPNSQGPWFIATCTVGKVKCTGEAKQKKQAKSLAARKMLLEAEKNNLQEMGKDDSFLTSDFLKTVTDAPGDNSKPVLTKEDSSALSAEGSASNLDEMNSPSDEEIQKDGLEDIAYDSSEQALCQRLADDSAPLRKIFAKQEPGFTIFSKQSVSGEVQCLMELLTPEGESCVFPGWGMDVDKARVCACSNALLYARTFLS